MAAQEGGDFAARGADRRMRGATGPVETRGVAKMRFEQRLHGGGHFGRDWRARIEIQIDLGQAFILLRRDPKAIAQ